MPHKDLLIVLLVLVGIGVILVALASGTSREAATLSAHEIAASTTPCKDCDYPACPNNCCEQGCSAESVKLHRHLLESGAFAGRPSASCYRCSMTPGSYEDCSQCEITERASFFK